MLSLALFLTSCGTQTTNAADMQISDGANVLNINRVKTGANDLSRSIAIFTTSTFTFEQSMPTWITDANQKENYRKSLLPTEFDTHTKDYMGDHKTDIAIGIDVQDRYISIQSVDNVPLSNKEAKEAVGIFGTNFANNDYTTALLATLKDLRTVISTNENAQFWHGVWNVLEWIGIVAVLILISVMSKIFGWSSSNRNGRYYHHHHSSDSGGSSSSSSSSSDSGSSGGGAGGFF
ncbi:hypothetical protein KSF_047910 [Reticulibacter mediterranei]|uniref:TPM domain-containing protein n=1 Tax=Reticulibacter mediterranei TaxID=2778369 RepID=A0A8J3IJC2_9CHLR|nr:hypothetical protein KSF_047910 [Reticulibacter mediterranei]